MQALLFPAFDYIAKNRWAQIAVLLGGGFVILKMRDKWRDRRTTKRVERRIEKKSRKVQARIEERNHEKSIEVERARASAPSGVPHADGVRDDLASVIFSD